MSISACRSVFVAQSVHTAGKEVVYALWYAKILDASERLEPELLGYSVGGSRSSDFVSAVLGRSPRS